MAAIDLGYLTLYAVNLASIVFIVSMIAVYARRTSTSLDPTRVIGLVRDEFGRLKSMDAVFLMHVSIALGVGLSIGYSVLNPVINVVPFLETIFLILSVPLVAGLVSALGWRVQRYRHSKLVEKELGSNPSFTSASTALQLILIVAIVMTTIELLLFWFPTLALVGGLVGFVRNILVAVFYATPTVNLIGHFDEPLATVKTPFSLADVSSGKTDASQVRIGVSKTTELDLSQRLSVDSCVEIGACEAACPATAAGRPLSPRILVRKVSLLADSPSTSESDVSKSVPDDELWSCTSCGACVSSCPVSVKHLDIIYDLRRNLVAKGRLDKEKSAMLDNLAQSQNPYGFKNATRGDWAQGLGLDSLSKNSTAEYVYWVGCVSSFDQRAQRIAKAFSKILREAGVSFAILGSDEMCVGDPARRLGEEGRYQELAYQNIDRLNSYGIKKIIATCPHCFNALRNEYPSFGGKYEVVYHTQLISDLIRQGRLKIPPERIRKISVTLHDACYASRYNNVFDEPRAALDASVSTIKEMKRRKDKTFCCGAGGSNYWYNVPQQRSIASIRTEEARNTGASEIATECPFCLSMLDDASKVMNVGMEVKDVAEIVAECLP